MWAYRIERPYSITSASLRREDIEHVVLGWGRTTFDAATKIALDLCRHIDWDGTWFGQMRYFTVPGIHELALGYMFQDIQRRTFIVSPISLPHMAKGLDWDAMVSHEEINQAQRAVRTGEIAKPRATVEPWQVSRKGNLFTKVNGCSVTVFDTDKGYKAICNPINREPIYTRTFPTQTECCAYVEEHWYDIIDPPDHDGRAGLSDEDLDW